LSILFPLPPPLGLDQARKRWPNRCLGLTCLGEGSISMSMGFPVIPSVPIVPVCFRSSTLFRPIPPDADGGRLFNLLSIDFLVGVDFFGFQSPPQFCESVSTPPLLRISVFLIFQPDSHLENSPFFLSVCSENHYMTLPPSTPVCFFALPVLSPSPQPILAGFLYVY